MGRPEISRVLDPDGSSLIHHAVMGGLAQLLEWLLKSPDASYAVTLRNHLGQTALHLCADHRLVSMGPMMAARLLAVGAVVNAKDHYDATPLIEAVLNEDECMVNLLLNARADPNCFSNANSLGHGDTPLVSAVRLKNVAVVRLLLGAPSINIRQKTMFGDLPFAEDALSVARTAELRALLTEALAKQTVES